MSGIINLVSSDSDTPSLEEIYEAEDPKIYSNNNNKNIIKTDFTVYSDSDDLPEFDFSQNGEILTNKKTDEPCSSFHTSDSLIHNIIPTADIERVTDDVRITGDVNLSINRYFDGTISTSIISTPADQSNVESESDFTPLSSHSKHTFHSRHDNPQIFQFKNDVIDKPTDSSVSKSLFLDTKSVNNEEVSDDDFNLFFSPLSNNSFEEETKLNNSVGKTEIETTTKTKTRKHKQDPIIQKQKEVEKLNKEEQHTRKYTIKTTTNLDKQLLSHLRNGLESKDISFETCESELDLEYLIWECEQSIYSLSEQNEIQMKRRRIGIEYICFVFSLKTFSNLFQKDATFLEKILPTLPQSKYLILFHGVKDYFSHLQPGDLSRDRFDTIITQFQIKFHITTHLSNTTLEASDILIRVMRGVKGISTKREKIFSFHVHSPKKGRKVKTFEERTNLWRRQLMQIPRISEIIANAIIEKYPTPHELKIAFDTCGSEKEKRELLKDIFVLNGINKRRIGLKLSEKIFLIFNSKDSEIKI